MEQSQYAVVVLPTRIIVAVVPTWGLAVAEVMRRKGFGQRAEIALLPVATVA